MLAFVLASFILPSVLGHCCYPDQLSGVTYTIGDNVNASSRVMYDFKEKKYIIAPLDAVINFHFIDIAREKVFTLYKDGSCVTSVYPSSAPVAQCIPDSATHFVSATLAGSMIDAYRMSDPITNSKGTLGVTKDCLPVVVVLEQNGSTTTSLYTNVTDSVPYGVFNVDLSECDDE